MSNVVIIEKHIGEQKVGNIDKEKVSLPFNVTKPQSTKVGEMLSNLNLTLSYDATDKLNIKSLSMGSTKVLSADREIAPSHMTLGKTYEVTMKKEFVSKAENFFDKIIKEDTTPIFEIKDEDNLQRALEEATTEIDLTQISNAISKNQGPLPEETPIENFQQTISNNPNGQMVYGGPLNAGQEIEKLNNQEMTNMPLPQDNYATQPNIIDKPKVKVKKLSGKVLVVPIVLVWLAFVLIGTVKLVTNILS